MKTTMQLMEALGLHEGGVENWIPGNAWESFANLIRADEREACVKFLEHINLGNLPPDLALYYASLINSLVNGIRARVNT